ncbi:MAG: hypothetical protein ABIS14_08175 [Sphingomonas sp.]
MDDDEFEPRLGRMRAKGAKRSQKYLSLVVAAARRSGARSGIRNRRFDGSRIGRGAILGADYGFVPTGSTLSATHQEYREARETKPVLAFVQQGVDPDERQAAFIAEVQAWEGGLFRGGFMDADDLQDGIVRALHDADIAVAVGPVDQQDVAGRAVALLPSDAQGQGYAAKLDIAIAGGPTQRILRPSQLEATDLAEYLQQAAMFGAHRVFDRSLGSESGLDGSDLVIGQEGGASLRLTEQGSLAIRVPFERRNRDWRGGGTMDGMVIVEEDVQARLDDAIGYAADVLARVDGTERLTHLAIAVRIADAEYRAWRTRAQHAASSGSMQIGYTGTRDQAPVLVSVRRAALRLGRTDLIEDLVVPLRRRFAAG